MKKQIDPEEEADQIFLAYFECQYENEFARFCA